MNNISIGFHHNKSDSFLELRFNKQTNYWAQLPAAVAWERSYIPPPNSQLDAWHC